MGGTCDRPVSLGEGAKVANACRHASDSAHSYATDASIVSWPTMSRTAAVTAAATARAAEASRRMVRACGDRSATAPPCTAPTATAIATSVTTLTADAAAPCRGREREWAESARMIGWISIVRIEPADKGWIGSSKRTSGRLACQSGGLVRRFSVLTGPDGLRGTDSAGGTTIASRLSHGTRSRTSWQRPGWSR